MCFNRKKSLNSQTNSGRHAMSSNKTLNEIISLLLTELRPRNAQGPATSDILCRLRASSDEVGRNVTMLPCWCCPKWNKVETMKTNIHIKNGLANGRCSHLVFWGAFVGRAGQVIPFGQVSRYTAVRPARFPLQLQQGGLASVPATPGRKGAAQWSQRDFR